MIKRIKRRNYSYIYDNGVVKVMKNGKLVKEYKSSKDFDIGGIFSKRKGLALIVYALVMKNDEQYYYVFEGENFQLWKKLDQH